MNVPTQSCQEHECSISSQSFQPHLHSVCSSSLQSTGVSSHFLFPQELNSSLPALLCEILRSVLLRYASFKVLERNWCQRMYIPVERADFWFNSFGICLCGLKGLVCSRVDGENRMVSYENEKKVEPWQNFFLEKAGCWFCEVSWLDGACSWWRVDHATFLVYVSNYNEMPNLFLHVLTRFMWKPVVSLMTILSLSPV